MTGQAPVCGPLLLRWLVGMLSALLATTGACALHGTLRMDSSVQQPGLQQLRLNAGKLSIDAVELAGQALAFERTGNQLRITLPANLPVQTPQQLQVRYTGEGSNGLRFNLGSSQVATAFSTSLWMPCLDDPAVRAPFTLRLLLPPDLASVGNGSAEPPQQRNDGKLSHKWHLDQPMPSYLYGFAAGPF